ncbi:MAG: isoprenylcysteine carboxylmethyltransferase family protein [Gammaproteobacteria bacterium]|nr:isoprenylcysteine carboxylmethyltransferase family protein [Gammaproteobacteria bacterium]
MLILKGLIGTAVQIASFAAMLLLPAGTLDWPRAIQFLVAHGVLSLTATIVLALYAPASLEARMQGPVHKSQPKADRVISFLLFPLLCAWFVSIPLEVFHLHWLPAPGFMVSMLGAGLFFIGYAIILISVYQNEFAAPIVKDQSERGHVLVDTGLYGCIRHPLYLGFVLYFIGVALWLESYLSLFLLSVIFAILVARIFVEEKTLRETLPGYIEYMTRVRYRIIPFAW